MGPKLTHKEKKEKDRLRKAAAAASRTEDESSQLALLAKGRYADKKVIYIIYNYKFTYLKKNYYF